MAVKNQLLLGFIGFTLLQAADVEPKGCSCKSKDASKHIRFMIGTKSKRNE